MPDALPARVTDTLRSCSIGSPGAHYLERATAINSCNSVFTSRFIFRYAFPGKITVSDDVYFESKLLLPV